MDGEKGDRGYSGLPGLKGDSGDVSEKGQKGEVGAPGNIFKIKFILRCDLTIKLLNFDQRFKRSRWKTRL